MSSHNGQRINSFSDLGQAYAEAIASPAYLNAFGQEIALAQLSIHDEPTQDVLPDADQAQACVEQVTTSLFALFAETRLESLAPRLAWGIVNSFHMVARQVERQEDDAAKELGELARQYDPSEIYQTELEDKQRLCQSMAEAREVLEVMRDHAAQVYHVATGKPWQSTQGSRVSSALTASQIEARDFLATRAKQRREQLAPSGPIVVISGGHIWDDYAPIYARLDAVKARIPSMTLATTAQRSGVDAIAAAWAASQGVPIIAFRLNRAHGNAAPFKRNQMLVSLDPVEAIVCEGSGIQSNLAQRCRDAGVPLFVIRKGDQSQQLPALRSVA